MGAHANGLIGEDPQDIPNNLLPFVAQVAVGRQPCLNVWGNDYPTPDGTVVRDFILVVDLALGHLKALQALERLEKNEECLTVNLGTGTGYSVLEIVRAFDRPADGLCHTRLRLGVLVTLPHAMPIRNGRFNCSAGARSVGSMRCARMPGAGRVSILTGLTRVIRERFGDNRRCLSSRRFMNNAG